MSESVEREEGGVACKQHERSVHQDRSSSSDSLRKGRSLDQLHKTDWTHGRKQKPPPAPSCVSMKSDMSMGTPFNFKDGHHSTDQRRSKSPAPSGYYSMKSDWSMNHPRNFKDGHHSTDLSCISMKSDWSIDLPYNFKDGHHSTDLRSVHQDRSSSSDSLRKGRSLDQLLKTDWTHGREQKPSPAPSCVSMKSDWSMGKPLNFKDGHHSTDQRVPEQRSSPVTSCDSMDQTHLVADAELRRIQQYAVDVTLDPDTAHPWLILSEDGKQTSTVPNNTERFNFGFCVLGKQSFSSGRFYYEVQVKGKTDWTLGVAIESINRKGQILLTPNNGYWTIWLRDGHYKGASNHSVYLLEREELQTVGVFVDYEEGLVSFYDVEARFRFCSYTGCSFTEKLYPYFSPCFNADGTNSAPLIISPVSMAYDAELRRIQQYAVDVTLDPDTAHPRLTLSEDGKQTSTVPNNTERFSKCVNVLGKQSFSSGRFYYEVQVKGKTEWTLGVARESINRKGSIKLNPNNGFWTIGLRKGNEYKAPADPPVLLPVREKIQKVGVFVDYEEGLVSFYDVEARVHLYSFTGCSFTEKLYPYFSPYLNDDGTNSAPLIISPVSKA